MGERLPLYREESLQQNKETRFGGIVLSKPPAFLSVTGISVAITVVFFTFLVFGSYAKTGRASGQLIPETGIISVSNQKVGVIIEKKVRDGDLVEKGQVLYIFSDDRINADGVNTQALTGRSYAERVTSIKRQLADLNENQNAKVGQLNVELTSMRKDLGVVSSMLESAKKKYALSVQQLELYRKLVEEGLVSKDDLVRIEVETINEKLQFDTRKREKIKLGADVRSIENELTELPSVFSKREFELNRELSSALRELTSETYKSSWSVLAPERGIVSGVLGEAGQRFSEDQTLLTIVPQDAELLAQLFVTNSNIGFTKVGDSVVIKLRAYPSRRYGTLNGTISEVSDTPVNINSFGSVDSSLGFEEPVFRILVGLDGTQQDKSIGNIPLQAGLLLDADIIRSKRPIWRWIFRPMTSKVKYLEYVTQSLT